MTLQHKESDAVNPKKIPTSIITGFLGAGKTTAILHLLAQKPQDEQWAILVNEFGEVGVDGSIIQGQHPDDSGITIKELPGGCMCCTAGISMKKALEKLITKVRPDRLLIEPTGLGHPSEVVGALMGKAFNDTIQLNKIVAIVDARHCGQDFYAEHPLFREQISIADVVVGNKSDAYKDSDQAALSDYVSKYGQEGAEIIITQQGALSKDVLVGEAQTTSGKAIHHHGDELKTLLTDLNYPESGILSVTNKGKEFESIGWRIHPEKVLDRQKVVQFFTSLNVERLKAVIITSEGIFSYNLSADSLTEQEIDECLETRIEIIAKSIDPSWEDGLLKNLIVDD